MDRREHLATARRTSMDRNEMLRAFEAHREAEAARDIDAILETFVPECFLETMPLGLRSVGRDAVRTAYESQFFTAFPDLTPDDEGVAFGDDVIVVWGTLRGTSRGNWLGIPPGGGSFAVPFANVAPFSQGLMAGRESISTSPPCVSRLGSHSRTSARPRPNVEERPRLLSHHP
jgi:predicted ester cyclase